jgi:tripartite-type tricarboxylate transporter receptor subunit TctC
VPAGTPPVVIARLNTEMGKALADGATRDKLMEATLAQLSQLAPDFCNFVGES